MKFIDCISAGFMMAGLVLGAMTGTIVMLLIPVAIGAGIYAISSWNQHIKEQKSISFSIPYPPYKY